MRKAPKARQLASHGPEVLAAVRLAGEVTAEAGQAYDARWNELAALVSTTAMDDAARGKIIGLMDLLYVIRLAHLHAEKLLRDAVGLTISKAPEIVKGVQRIRGGRNAGQGKKAEVASEHEGWIDQAKKAIATGTAPRDVSGKLAKRFGRSARTIRTALQKGGVLAARKKEIR